MAVDKTLSGLIEALATEQPEIVEGARVLSVRKGAAEALLDEVEATVLSASLQFQTDNATLALQVAGRRLVAIAGAEGIDLPANLIGAALSMDVPEQLSAAGAAIAQFAGDARSLLVTSTHMSNADVTESVSVAALRNAMGIVVDDPNASPIERFLARATGNVSAYLLVEGGEVTQTEGVPALVQSLKIALSTQLRPFLDARAANCPSHTDPSLTLCSDTIEAGKGMAVATCEGSVTIFAFESRHLANICEAWRKAQ